MNWLSQEQAAFNDFNSSGYINQIKDDDLKRKVFKIEGRINDYNTYLIELRETWGSLLQPYYTKHGNIIMMRDSVYKYKLPKVYTTLNKKAFINNPEFNSVLTNRMLMSWRAVGNIERIITFYNELIKEIDIYLQNHD